MAKVAALVLALTLAGCGTTIKLQWEDVKTRKKVNEVVQFANELESRVVALEAESAGGD